jgi:hypothetical protein
MRQHLRHQPNPDLCEGNIERKLCWLAIDLNASKTITPQASASSSLPRRRITSLAPPLLYTLLKRLCRVRESARSRSDRGFCLIRNDWIPYGRKPFRPSHAPPFVSDMLRSCITGPFGLNTCDHVWEESLNLGKLEGGSAETIENYLKDGLTIPS